MTKYMSALCALALFVLGSAAMAEPIKDARAEAKIVLAIQPWVNVFFSDISGNPVGGPGQHGQPFICVDVEAGEGVVGKGSTYFVAQTNVDATVKTFVIPSFNNHLQTQLTLWSKFNENDSDVLCVDRDSTKSNPVRKVTVMAVGNTICNPSGYYCAGKLVLLIHTDAPELPCPPASCQAIWPCVDGCDH
jgi:hypothetical protein